MLDKDEIRKRKFFQKVKSMSQEQFWRTMNAMHTRAYVLAENHYSEAMDITLQPKQKSAVIEKAKQIREGWDGIQEVTVDETEDVSLEVV